ncbi:MAG: flavodoxin domain-containing protein [Trueperaceae bacterium]
MFYGSTCGRTEAIAERIGERLSAGLGVAVPVHDVGVTDPTRLAESDLAVLGVPTWNVGGVQADWDAVLDDLARFDLRGVRVALFGAGDARGYPDTFGDALGIMAETVEAAGATLVGDVAADGYAFEASRALRGERLLGLLVDDGDADDAVGERTRAWCDALLAHVQLRPTVAAPPPPSCDRLRAMRVSEVLEAAPDALPLLLRSGFRPLADPRLRAVLAPTVTLEQAFRIRGLDDEASDAVLAQLQGAWPCR